MLTTVMVELLRSCQPVKWDGLGTFTPNVNSRGINDVESVSVDHQLLGLWTLQCYFRTTKHFPHFFREVYKGHDTVTPSPACNQTWSQRT